ncbi:MAG: Holliday junction branch migration protein RuvA [Cyanobacteriota bacterium]
MIGWLQGELSDPWQQGPRQGLMLRCHGVGYEVQITQRLWQQLPPPGAELALAIHHVIREDQWTLYGFADRRERDLFRELVAVSGVGPQMALGLLGFLAPQELVQAIVGADLKRLSQAPGVGKRTAERLAVELRARLQQRFLGLDPTPDDEDDNNIPRPAAGQRDELQLTLAALGYEPLEILQAQREVARMAMLEPDDGEGWLRECLRWLSSAGD